MGLLLLILSTTSFYQFLTPRSRNNDAGITPYVAGIITTVIGTYKSCSDGWMSSSIGSRGACSYHGGVEVFLNTFGWSALVASVIYLTYVLFIRD